MYIHTSKYRLSPLLVKTVSVFLSSRRSEWAMTGPFATRTSTVPTSAASSRGPSRDEPSGCRTTGVSDPPGGCPRNPLKPGQLLTKSRCGGCLIVSRTPCPLPLLPLLLLELIVVTDSRTTCTLLRIRDPCRFCSPLTCLAPVAGSVPDPLLTLYLVQSIDRCAKAVWSGLLFEIPADLRESRRETAQEIHGAQETSATMFWQNGTAAN